MDIMNIMDIMGIMDIIVLSGIKKYHLGIMGIIKYYGCIMSQITHRKIAFQDFFNKLLIFRNQLPTQKIDAYIQ